MPIANIIDNRTNRYNAEVSVVFEDSSHDNGITGSSIYRDAEMQDDSVDYFCIARTTISAAIIYATKWNHDITMYLYDIGSNPPCDIETI